MFLNFLLKSTLLVPQSDTLRKKWVAKQLLRIPKNNKVLDAGAGECYYAQYCKHLKYVSQDFNQYDGSGDGRGIQTKTRNTSKIDIVSDITNIPVKSASFDTVLCTEVFEHIPDPLKALKELTRVLKINGTLLATAPYSSLNHYSPFFFHTGFSVNFYKTHLPAYGFRIQEIYTYGNYFNHLALELARTPLVCWRISHVLSFLLLPVYFFLILPYIVLRMLAILLPSSRDLHCFGICIKARKIKRT